MTEKKGMEDEIAALRADMAAVRGDLEKLAGLLAKGAEREGPSDAKRERALPETWDELKQAFEDAREQSDRTVRELMDRVRQHPLASMAIAFGAGYVLSKLAKRGDE